MTDLASLVLSVDSTSVPRGTAALNDLTAAGTRAEAASVGLGRGFKGAGAEGAAMAVAAQASARAAMDQAAGFRVATDAARLNTIAMRETLVVARELSRGNFTRIPGSLSLLAANVQGGVSGFASTIANQLGLIKQVQNAELAEAAAAAANAAAGVEAAARKAAANVMAADTEIALAEAQLRVTEGTAAEAAAQIRLTAAHEAVAAAAAEAAVAEDALAVAMGRSAEASTASAAATRTVIGGAGIGLLGIAAVAGVAFGAIKEFQDQVRDDGTLTQFRDNLGLTHAEMLRLSDGVDTVGGHLKTLGDVTVTWGDVWHGIWSEVAREANDGGPWANLKNHALSAFDAILAAWNNVSAGITAGLYTIQNLLAGGAGSALGLAPGLVPTVNGGELSLSKNFAKAKAENAAAFGGVGSSAIKSAEDRMRAEADALKADRRGRGPRRSKEAVDHADDTIAKLDEQILSAKISLTKDATEEASLKAQELRVARDKTIADAQSLRNTHKITQTEFDAIKVRAQELDVLKERAVFNARDIKLLEQDQAAKDQLFGFQTDALKAADADATTQAEHRKIQLQMLDIAFEQKKYDLQILLSKQQIAGDLAGQALTQGQLNHLPTAQAQAQDLVLKNTRDPLQAWAASVPHTADQINEALQSIEVKGIDSLASSLAGVVTGTESLGKAFKDVARSIISDIIQMTVKMLIFRAISSIFGGFSAGPDPTSLLSTTGGITHFANGGSMIIGGNGGVDNNLLSLNGKPVAMVGQGERLAVYPKAAANNNSSGPIEIRLMVDTSENLDAKVDAKVIGGMQQAVRVSVNHTNQTLRAIARPKLGGG